MNRIGSKFGTRKQTRTQRQAVWYFVCRDAACLAEKFINARRRPTADPEDVPTFVHCGVEMENRGIYLLSFINGVRAIEPADALRKKWLAARERLLYGAGCTCGHEWWKHNVDREKMIAHACGVCDCKQFRRKHVTNPHLFERKPGDDVPF